jgi:chaperonin GroEL
VTDTKTQKCQYDDALVLVTDAKITSFKSIQPLLEAVLSAGRPLLIIAEDITGDALTTLVLNKLRAGLKVVAIKAPGFGEGRKATLQDVAIATGATLVDEELGIRFESVKLSQLGSCKKVTVARDDCVMVGGAGDKAEIAKRVEVIREHIKRAESNWERERLQERLSRLVSGIAMISVGGNSETESNELRDLFEDALNATRAALEEGIVPGGGVALVRTALALDKIRPDNLEQRTGVDIVRRAILQPLKQIVNNAGESGDVVAAKIVQSKSATLGFDAKTMEYGDMFKKGIVDPTKVVRLALLNAASVVSSMTAAELLVVEAPEEEQPAGVPKR